VRIEPGVRERVPPFEIAGVAEERYTGIFGDLHDVISLRQREARQRRHLGFEQVLERLRQEVSADEFAALQSRHLAAALDPPADVVTTGPHNWSYYPDPYAHLKYLDVCHWMESKYRRAVAHLGLNESKGQKILDLGCGAGHAVWVFRQMGHDAIGMDRRDDEPAVHAMLSLFDDLCTLLRVEWVEGRIKPFEPLRSLPSGFDIVTAFMGTFSRMDAGPAWGVEAWRFFLSDIFDNVLNEDGVLYLNMTRGSVSDLAWDFLATRADFADDATRTVRLRRPNP
jgi:hypothetical protein